jgi:hypothetical protein
MRLITFILLVPVRIASLLEPDHPTDKVCIGPVDVRPTSQE